MRYLKQGLEVGEEIEFGELNHVELKSSSGGVALEAISQGEEEPHVILKESGLDRGESIDLHEDAKLLGLSSGNSFVGSSVWYALPRSVYNE
ncbi:hypothetical protein HLRTI_000937 [Halorhabdus tiamatea SARL4B]|uniref:Uncharacterized protein n=1 Tax=Halorhabdus tiamatea SARL4B TaxID=1033806 RepID=U2FFP2_9EURY|nr:hypothetical protein HLRTI_000937 [Halorhabdus tiamatea SARL4B]